MIGRGPHFDVRPPARASWPVRILVDDRASLRIEYALLLATVGVLALLATVMIVSLRQRTFESLAAHITPMDDVGSGYYVVDVPTEPVNPAAATSWIKSIGVARPGAISLGTIGVALAAWYVVWSRRRATERQSNGQGRARSNHPPALVAAKRDAVRAALGQSVNDLCQSRLTVRQVMTDSVLVAQATATIQALGNMLVSTPLRHVVICDDANRVVGIVSGRDLRLRTGKTAADVMTREPMCVPPGALLGPAVTIMVDNQISCLPVVEKGCIRGALTLSDLAVALHCLLEAVHKLAAREATRVPDTVLISNIETLCTNALADDSVIDPESSGTVQEVRS
ncbi:MAG: CBS domain-containing protein [Planctomycetia bacterium]|nr:CBS domain-containing protein [Planctomycetia bacterium]